MPKSKAGRPKEYTDKDQLDADCGEYLQWCKDNPILEEKAFHANGLITKATVSHMRAPTIHGLCLHLGIARSTWYLLAKTPQFSDITKKYTDILYERKFTGAAAGMLNPNIIARDLGLKESSSVDHTMKSIDMSKLTDEQVAAIASGASIEAIESE
ncbi:terminase small subunit [uncultured Paraglaciecola sp.]|uniref:terminase small subunit n=1 Tax=uncultured Paraglaciecola sp. TaxID=1765024 RepID=UPI00260A528E|nr:terminase small subunit [uncultured Paraglaciecola sp.]